MFKIANFLLVIITFIFISACSADKEEVAPDASPVNTSGSDAPMPKPNAVVKRATEIPPATTAGEISFAIFISLNACIMPTTVPRKPITNTKGKTVLYKQ